MPIDKESWGTVIADPELFSLLGSRHSLVRFPSCHAGGRLEPGVGAVVSRTSLTKSNCLVRPVPTPLAYVCTLSIQLKGWITCHPWMFYSPCVACPSLLSSDLREALYGCTQVSATVALSSTASIPDGGLARGAHPNSPCKLHNVLFAVFNRSYAASSCQTQGRVLRSRLR
jgi:hypothetical protein